MGWGMGWRFDGYNLCGGEEVQGIPFLIFVVFVVVFLLVVGQEVGLG